MSNDIDRPVMTPAEFSDTYGLSVNTTLRLLGEGTIPAIRLGKRWFIPRAKMDAWLESAGASREAKLPVRAAGTK